MYVPYAQATIISNGNLLPPEEFLRLNVHKNQFLPMICPDLTGGTYS